MEYTKVFYFVLRCTRVPVAPAQEGRPIAILSSKDEPKYRQLYGNVYLDEPIMGLKERNMEIEKQAQEWERKFRETL